MIAHQLDKLYNKRDQAYETGNFEDAAHYDNLINNLEKADKMKDVKINQKSNTKEDKRRWYDQNGELRLI